MFLCCLFSCLPCAIDDIDNFQDTLYHRFYQRNNTDEKGWDQWYFVVGKSRIFYYKSAHVKAEMVGCITISKMNALWLHASSKRFVLEMENGLKHDLRVVNKKDREVWLELLNREIAKNKANLNKEAVLVGIVKKKSGNPPHRWQERVLELCKSDRKLVYYKDMDHRDVEVVQGMLFLTSFALLPCF